MKSTFRSSVAAVSLLTSLLTASSAFAMGSMIYTGNPGDQNAYDRVVNITPNTRWVNANAGETIKFVDGTSGKSFVWHFDVAHWSVIDLNAVAPEALGGRHITAYVNSAPEEAIGD